MAAEAKERTTPRPWVMAAALFEWDHHPALLEDVAKACGRSSRQLRRVRRTPEYDTAYRLVAKEASRALYREAYDGLKVAWKKGVGSEAARKVLVGGQIVPPERIEHTGADGGPINIDNPELNARIAGLLAERAKEES